MEGIIVWQVTGRHVRKDRRPDTPGCQHETAQYGAFRRPANLSGMTVPLVLRSVDDGLARGFY